MKTVDEVKHIVESEGLAYAIQHYLNPNDISDPVLRDEWIRAKQSLEKLEEMLDIE